MSYLGREACVNQWSPLPIRKNVATLTRAEDSQGQWFLTDSEGTIYDVAWEHEPEVLRKARLQPGGAIHIDVIFASSYPVALYSGTPRGRDLYARFTKATPV